jgi:putative NIF3 family GTP cyclohydrolase 1 type 2
LSDSISIMKKSLFNSPFSRRHFIASTAATVGIGALITSRANASSEKSQKMTIKDVIDIIKGSIQFSGGTNTVDTVKAGDVNQPVNGIVTTMFATIEVIRKAVELNANFIIAHEPTFYNHLDETSWLESSDVYKYKLNLLKKHNIVVWRFHDYWHSNKPDGIYMGVLTALGWEKYYDESNTRMLTIPGMKLSDIIALAKSKLDIPTVRYIGDRSHLCSKISLLPGAWGGRNHIQTLTNYKPDLIIVGELQEWETSEYIRDTRAMGIKQSLLVLGHSVSEEPGMKWLLQWLQPKVKGIKITNVPSNNPFQWA